MGYSCFDCVALARRYFFVFEQARHQYANVIGKLLLQSEQNVLPLRYDGLCILQKPVNHVFLSLFWQLNHLRYDLFYASGVPRGQ